MFDLLDYFLGGIPNAALRAVEEAELGSLPPAILDLTFKVEL